ncbi:p53 and DNA damage-regulated protein 1 [Chytridiales sp. JEL 0842]|nr:p53 and DNA damage-regulated protein 1 [Chytridiales sp. JEL 0842]
MDVIAEQAEIERLAEDILTDKQLVVDYDRKRNENREALRHFYKNTFGDDKKVWFFTNGLILKMGQGKVKGMLEEEQQKLDKEIASLRDSIRERTIELNQREQKASTTSSTSSKTAGFSLKPLQQTDLEMLRMYSLHTLDHSLFKLNQ